MKWCHTKREILSESRFACLSLAYSSTVCVIGRGDLTNEVGSFSLAEHVSLKVFAPNVAVVVESPGDKPKLVTPAIAAFSLFFKLDKYMPCPQTASLI